jgi:glycosyltransferase involved in cell wall biosynthesis
MSLALDILKADETLRAAFLLRFASESGSAAFTDEKASKFLLWFALEGRHEHRQTRFSAEYIAFLARPQPPFSTRLAAYVLMRRKDVRHRLGEDPDRFHAWYYFTGVTELGLGCFVTPGEQRFLAEVHPAFAQGEGPISRLEYYSLLHDPALQADFDIATLQGREGLARHLTGTRNRGALPWCSPPPPVDNSHLPGVNILGFANGVLGIGEDARALNGVLAHAGVMRAIYSIALPEKTTTSDSFGTEALAVDQPVFPVNIFALTAFETARLKIERGANLFAGRYNIGYWPWELTSLPEDWLWVFDLVDEIWASSDFLANVYARMTDKPVYLVPFYLNVPAVTHVPLQQFGLGGDDIVFLTLFDFNSYVARKNPEAAIAAFQAAFPDRSGPERLLIKTLNAHAHPEALQAIEAQLGDDDRFVVIDGAFSRAEIGGLIAAADCFVSLHRAEGFGRVIAEAMLLQTSVVATDWSGNVSFLDHDNGYPVDYTLRPVRPGEYVFAEGSQWAEPSLTDAARQLRRARDNLFTDGARRERARDRVERQYSLSAAADAVTARLAALAEAHGVLPE